MLIIKREEIKKNTRLTDFEDIREFIIANAIKGTKLARKIKTGDEDRMLSEFK